MIIKIIVITLLLSFATELVAQSRRSSTRRSPIRGNFRTYIGPRVDSRALGRRRQKQKPPETITIIGNSTQYTQTIYVSWDGEHWLSFDIPPGRNEEFGHTNFVSIDTYYDNGEIWTVTYKTSPKNRYHIFDNKEEGLYDIQTTTPR
ncbi:MAG: hypothetical protein GY775_09540 [Candidatus Scalindua sp.]|nr:hypothetical protein [Candidatus Scalindua sp.]